MMRELYFGIALPFDEAEATSNSEDILNLLMGVVSRLNLHYLNRFPKTKSLYDSGVVYSPPDQTTAPKLTNDQIKSLLTLLKTIGVSPETALQIVKLARGTEVFLDIPTLYARGEGDCNELVPVRVAELWRAGVKASPYLTKARNAHGGLTYHATVLWPDGTHEDPSLLLGMGGVSRAPSRREEIRKNRERFDTRVAGARQLVDEGEDPVMLGEVIQSLCLLPKNGKFSVPWERN